MCFILCNLAYIEDEVIRKVDFSKPGWSFKFRDDMNEYKKKWNARPDNEKCVPEWKFQDDELEKKYYQFKKKIDQTEQGLSETNLEKNDFEKVKKTKEKAL